MEKRRVVITGMGAVTPMGLTVPESWEAVQGGACAASAPSPITIPPARR